MDQNPFSPVYQELTTISSTSADAMSLIQQQQQQQQEGHQQQQQESDKPRTESESSENQILDLSMSTSAAPSDNTGHSYSENASRDPSNLFQSSLVDFGAASSFASPGTDLKKDPNSR